MRLSRHAKNQARRLGVDLTDAKVLIAHPLEVDHDEFGKPRYTGKIRGIRVRIVVALDEPDLIVTIHERRK
jgi:acetylglutamate kinase